MLSSKKPPTQKKSPPNAETPDAKELAKFAKSKEVLESPERIEAVATYILDNYDRKTNQSSATSYEVKRPAPSTASPNTT